MPALTFQGCLAKFSINYDGITVYYKGNETDSTHGYSAPCQGLAPARKRMQLAMTSCYRLGLIEVDTREELIDAGISSASHLPQFDRYIHNTDEDHRFYHRDNFAMEEDHSHIKFKFMMTRERLSQILDIFIKNAFTTSEEQKAILAAFDKRYSDARTALDKILTHDKKVDSALIKAFIKTCEENDILVNLHEYLLSRAFDYLRDNTKSPTKTSSPAKPAKVWVGLDAKGDVTETSKTWAMIEECITLQMGNNLRNQVDRFSSAVAAARANQLKDNLKFFAISHLKSSPMSTNDCFNAFASNDMATFNAEFKRHFEGKTLKASAPVAVPADYKIFQESNEKIKIEEISNPLKPRTP